MTAPNDAVIARARQLYREGVPVSQILGECEMSLGTLYLWVDGGPDDGSGPRLQPIARRRTVVGKRRRSLKSERISLVARLWRTAERQVRDIEFRLRKDNQQPTERERDARMLAVMVKTLRELNQIDSAASEQQAKQDEHDRPPRDLEELGRELARRVEILRSRRALSGNGGGVS